jgi:hypothetical protein
MNTLEFKSPRDGSTLTFVVRARHKGEVEFDLRVQTPRFSGTASASTYMMPSPAKLFDEMADEWTGWNGQKTWSDLEQSVSIAATSDRIGHVSLRITLDGPDGESRLQVCLEFEAGQLQSMASAMVGLFHG